MEVYIQSTLREAQTQTTVVTDSDSTVDSLISAFCVENGIIQKRNYVLRDCNGELLDNCKKLITCQINCGDILYLGLREMAEGEKSSLGCNQWWIFASVSLFIGGAGLFAVTILQANNAIEPIVNGVVIDAGSSKTRSYIYEWKGGKLNNTAVAEEKDFKCTSEALSSFELQPEKAGPSMSSCLKATEGQILSSEQDETEIFLGATAGMRLLHASNKTASDLIMTSVRDEISRHPFNFSRPDSQARIIEGEQEAAYGWVTVNYAHGTFYQSFTEEVIFALFDLSKTPIGALDLGGASTQITFIPEYPSQTKQNYTTELQLYGANYTVYSNSYLCYGANEAFRQYLAYLVKKNNFSTNIMNPCGAIGNETTFSYDEIFEVPCTKTLYTPDPVLKNSTFTFKGESNSYECHEAAKNIFNFSSCANVKNCSFNGVYQPDVYGDFYAFSGFYYTMADLKLPETFTLQEFRNVRDIFCNQSWDKVVQYDWDNDIAIKQCFTANYIDLLLIDGYGFTADTWSNIKFVPKVNGISLGWSLGFMLLASNHIPAAYGTDLISTSLFVGLTILFCLFVIIAVGFGCFAMKKNKGRTHFSSKNSYGAL